MKQLILASQSPRRQELLARLVKDFAVLTDDSEEKKIPGESPENTVMRLAREKAVHVAQKADITDALIIGADTVVVYDGTILGKPKNEADAKRMLQTLSGKTHQVFTGFAVLDKKTDRCVTAYESTEVRFCTLSEKEIDAYIATGEPMDKAGAYGIQEKGALLVEGIEGDYFNVVGLPLCKLCQTLKEQFQLDLLVP